METIKMIAEIAAILFINNYIQEELKRNWWKETEELKELSKNMKKECNNIIDRYTKTLWEEKVKDLVKKYNIQL